MAAAASTIGPGGPFSDPPPPLLLSGEQLQHCSEALAFFKQKLRNPAKIAQEFDLLQVPMDSTLGYLFLGAFEDFLAESRIILIFSVNCAFLFHGDELVFPMLVFLLPNKN